MGTSNNKVIMRWKILELSPHLVVRIPSSCHHVIPITREDTRRHMKIPERLQLGLIVSSMETSGNIK